MFKFFAISLTILAVTGDIFSENCVWCRTVLDDASTHFFPHANTTNDLQFAAYFKEQCPKYGRFSVNLMGVCEFMVSTYPLTVFDGVRKGTLKMLVCHNCKKVC